MNDLMSVKRLRTFSTLLSAYKKADIDLGDAIDGGAGSGKTGMEMLEFLRPNAVVHAFEPFPGNHRFFEGLDSRIKLAPKALAEANKSMSFRVPSVVAQDSVWGKRGMQGYSSVGALVSEPMDTDLVVDCVRADSVVTDRVGFVKLDLQGGERNALLGMANLLPQVALMWVEYLGHEGLLDCIIDQGFIVFDTEYLMIDNPTDKALKVFDVSRRDVPLSNGRNAWFGFKRRPWKNFEVEFHTYKKQMGLVQTDLVCVNRKFLSEFLAAAQHI